jgi:hypothetical protein
VRTMIRIVFIILLLQLASATCFGQTSFMGLTPGQSTKTEVERALGQPASQVSESLFKYAKGDNQVYVQYSKTSPTAIRVQVVYAAPRERSQVISAENLPRVADTRRPNTRGVVEEYFGYPKYVVLTLDENSQTQITQAGYYSRELFESATPELARSASTTITTLVTPGSGAIASDIPLLNAKVKGLRLYESGVPSVPLGQRHYSNRFSSARARGIYWELGLVFPDPGHRIDYTAEAIIYRDGAFYASWKTPVYIKEGYTNAAPFGGYGAAQPGKWHAGSYVIELFVEGRKVGAASFAVY